MKKNFTRFIFIALAALIFVSAFFLPHTANASTLCPDGETYYDTSIDECPFYLCPDGSTEVHEPDLSTCPEGTLCWNGDTVWPPDECPPELVECWDGSFEPTLEDCPPETETCPDGTEVPVGTPCPEYCNNVKKPAGGGDYQCCTGSSVADIAGDDVWCHLSGARQCRDKDICNPEGKTQGGMCSGTDNVCAVSVSNSCNDDEDCDTATHCLDGTTVYPPETCPDGACPNPDGTYDSRCTKYLCPDGVTQTFRADLSDCPAPTACSDGSFVWPPNTCPTLPECRYEITVEYGINKLLYRAIYSEFVATSTPCNPPTDAQIATIVQYRLDPLPEQGPPPYNPVVTVAPIDQCPGPSFPGNQSVDDYISGGYTRNADGFCVINGECNNTAQGECTKGTATEVTLIDGAYNWTCEGEYGGTDDSCLKSIDPTDGECAGTAGVCTQGTATPTPATLLGGSYHWTCLGSDGGADDICTGCTTLQNLCGGLLPDGTCSTEKYCAESGTCVPASQPCTSINTATTTLITRFNMVPRFVASSTEFCQATWEADIPQDGDGNDIGGCTLNGASVPPSSSATKAPGTYVFSCETGGTSQTKTSKCEVTPSVIER